MFYEYKGVLALMTMKRSLFQIEPQALIDAVLQNPPSGFEALPIEINTKKLPAFLTEFDLLITADEPVQRFIHKISPFLPKKICQDLLRPRTLFVGTTVSEFSLFPNEIDVEELPNILLEKMSTLKTKFLVVKDIAPESPLFSETENCISKKLCQAFTKAGFILLDGQAMAYIPLDFDSLDTFFSRQSASRRSDWRRKRKKRSVTELHVMKTGDPLFQDEKIIDCFYSLYENVYNKSEIHFEKLTRPFFRKILTDKHADGHIFAYTFQGEWIGYSLCFHYGDYFIDKYHGAKYPEYRNNNLYYVSWFDTLEYALEHGYKTAVFGWTNPEIKAYLGSSFLYSTHAVYIANPLLRNILKHFAHTFESDRKTLENWYAQHQKHAHK
jgi:uncharacterized protein